MKVLKVCSGNFDNPELNFPKKRAFIYDQIVDLTPSLSKLDLFFIKGKGFFGYLKNILKLRKIILEENYDIIHAHYGMSGLLANLAFTGKPIVVTYHGTDITDYKTRILSLISIYLSDYNIFVSEKLLSKANIKINKSTIIPCGVNFEIFHPITKKEACAKLGIRNDVKRILFASSFDNKIKNYPLAKASVELIEDEIEFLEINNMRREEVALYINASDLLLLTSFSEGSPQIIKEAMSCNCPIVATDVGDIKTVISSTQGCYMANFDKEDVASKINLVLNNCSRTKGRENLSNFDNILIAKKILSIYKKIISK